MERRISTGQHYAVPPGQHDGSDNHHAADFQSSSHNDDGSIIQGKSAAAAAAPEWRKRNLLEPLNNFCHHMKQSKKSFILTVAVAMILIHITGFMSWKSDYVLQVRRQYNNKEVKPDNNTSSNHGTIGVPLEHHYNHSNYNDTLRGGHQKELTLMMIRPSMNDTNITEDASSIKQLSSLSSNSSTVEDATLFETTTDGNNPIVDDANKDAVLPSPSSSSSLVDVETSRPKKAIECWSVRERCAILLNRTNVTTIIHDDTRHYDNDNNNGSVIHHQEEEEQPKTLALNDPVLRGGYRNQYMAFVSFVVYALQNGYDQILLPSIRWNCDHLTMQYDAVVFDQLFDVDHWNEQQNLPRMVPYNESEHYDWDPSTGLYHGACPVLDSYLGNDPELKRIILNRTGHFQHPPSYGGGWGLGELWYNYRGHDGPRRDIRIKNWNKTLWNETVPFLDVEAEIIRAIRPTVTVERILQQTLKGGKPPYIALHARIEPEMLAHGMCLDRKVYNLTTIFDMVRAMDHDPEVVAANPTLYIAIGLPEMYQENKWGYHLEHSLNLVALQDALKYGLELPSTGQNLTVTAGSHVAIDNDVVVDSCANEIVSTVISSEIAVRADIFIGTFISSWSTTVWKSRHALGRGRGNYAYHPNGIVNITGAPLPFTC